MFQVTPAEISNTNLPSSSEPLLSGMFQISRVFRDTVASSYSKYAGLTILLGLGLTGCSEATKPDTSMKIASPLATNTVEANQRFSVERVGVFEDKLAYNELRGIYIIRDKTTGKEFIGLSGVGISEVGSHRAGKAAVTDEQ